MPPVVPPAPAPGRARASITVAAAAASWGTWSVFLRPAELPSATAGVLVLVVMGVATLPAALRAAPVRWDRTTLALLAGNALLDAVNVLTFFAAMQTTTVAIAVLTHYLAPVLVALAAPRIERQAVRGAVPASLVAITGLALVLEPWRSGGAPLGAALGAISAVAYAGNVFVVRRLGQRIGAARAISYHALAAAVLMAPFALVAGGHPTVGGVAWLTLGAIATGAVAGAAFVWGLGRIGSARAAMLTYLEPLVAVAVSALVWDEPLARYAAVGGALVIASGVYVAREGSRSTAGSPAVATSTSISS
ncbi:MAG: EamA family transporter [Myxococcales bacterium]|nr:EamA family transporter [Myxococcales bacterium]